MEVEQTNFVTHLIITVQLYYWLSKKPSVKIWSNKFQTVMINYGKLCASLQENLMIEFYTNWAKVKFYIVCRLYSIVHFAIETTKTSHFTCQSKSFISIFFTCQVSACELQPFSCHDLANDIYAQTTKTVFSHLDECSFLHLNFSFKTHFVWEVLSSIRHSVSSPNETARSSSKTLRCASYFQLSSRCFIWWWNTVSHAWYITLLL